MTQRAVRAGIGVAAVVTVAGAAALVWHGANEAAPQSARGEPAVPAPRAERTATPGAGGGMGATTERIETGVASLTPEQRAGAVIGSVEHPNDIAYCDEANWRGISRAVAEIAAGELVVDPAEWAKRATGGRLGLARWASRCLFEGGPVRIVDAATRRVLARYSPERGFRPIEEAESDRGDAPTAAG